METTTVTTYHTYFGMSRGPAVTLDDLVASVMRAGTLADRRRVFNRLAMDCTVRSALIATNWADEATVRAFLAEAVVPG